MIKKILLYKKSYFPEPGYSKSEIKIELDLSNYSTKSDLKSETGVDTSKFATKSDLAVLKATIDKSDVDEWWNEIYHGV